MYVLHETTQAWEKFVGLQSLYVSYTPVVSHALLFLSQCVFNLFDTIFNILHYVCDNTTMLLLLLLLVNIIYRRSS